MTSPLLLRSRLVTIARRELDDRTLTPGQAQEILDRLDDLELLAEAVRDYIAEPSRDNEDRLAEVNLRIHRG